MLILKTTRILRLKHIQVSFIHHFIHINMTNPNRINITDPRIYHKYSKASLTWRGCWRTSHTWRRTTL